MHHSFPGRTHDVLYIKDLVTVVPSLPEAYCAADWLIYQQIERVRFWGALGVSQLGGRLLHQLWHAVAGEQNAVFFEMYGYLMAFCLWLYFCIWSIWNAVYLVVFLTQSFCCFSYVEIYNKKCQKYLTEARNGEGETSDNNTVEKGTEFSVKAGRVASQAGCHLHCLLTSLIHHFDSKIV